MLLLFALAAFLYAMVGHGGGSAYLAIMGMTGWPREEMRVTALTLNIAVSGLAWLTFLSRGGFRWRLWAFCALGGMPAAWLGGKLGAPAPIFWAVVGAALLLAAFRTAFPGVLEKRAPGSESPSDFRNPHSAIRVPLLWVPVCAALRDTRVPRMTGSLPWLLIGAALGFVAGACGIGGGVFLGPALILAGAATPFEAAGVSAAYIFVNSAAGLSAAHWPASWSPSPVLIGIVVVAGALGAQIGARKASPLALRRALGAALTVAAAKCFLNAF